MRGGGVGEGLGRWGWWDGTLEVWGRRDGDWGVGGREDVFWVGFGDAQGCPRSSGSQQPVWIYMQSKHACMNMQTLDESTASHAAIPSEPSEPNGPAQARCRLLTKLLLQRVDRRQAARVDLRLLVHTMAAQAAAGCRPRLAAAVCAAAAAAVCCHQWGAACQAGQLDLGMWVGRGFGHGREVPFMNTAASTAQHRLKQYGPADAQQHYRIQP